MQDTTEVPSTFLKHLERQQKILAPLLKSQENVLLLEASELLEKTLFTPNTRPEKKKLEDGDPRLNFYPPFLVPESLAQHFPFFQTVPVPRSCKANRTQTETYNNWQKLDQLPCTTPDPLNTSWDDSLGNVSLSAELESEQKIALLKHDSERLSWWKTKAKNMKMWGYPALSLPPVVQRVLLEKFVGKPQDPNNLEEKYEMALSDTVLKNLGISTEDYKEKRSLAATAATYGFQLECMTDLLCNPKFVHRCQESLHYTFGHGFVKLVHVLTDVNLSDYVTFHGMTHKNRLNHNRQHTQLDHIDRWDYLIDCIYLFLVMTWQTAMDIWGQTIDESVISSMKTQLEDNLERILKETTSKNVAIKMKESIFPPLLLDALLSSLPDFINQTQLANFRTFICLKSGIPQAICPALPSDFVPLTFSEAHPVLWNHVLFLNMSSFLLNHGNYMNVPAPPHVISQCYCDCNLCSPHKMPCYNPNLLNEILTIDNFEMQGPPDESGKPTKIIKITPAQFANAYLMQFPQGDYHHNKVIYYKNKKECFTLPLEACLIKNDSLLAAIRETQLRREKELLKRGSGIYLDPLTGEPLTGTDPSAAHSMCDESHISTDGTPGREKLICLTTTTKPKKRRDTPHPKILGRNTRWTTSQSDINRDTDGLPNGTRISEQSRNRNTEKKEENKENIPPQDTEK